MPPCWSGSGWADRARGYIENIPHEWMISNENAMDIDESWNWIHILWEPSSKYFQWKKNGMTDLTWNATHKYNLFKCWRFTPDRTPKKLGHDSNLRRGYQRCSNSSWNEKLIALYPSSIMFIQYSSIFTSFHTSYPLTSQVLSPATSFMTEPWPSGYRPRKPSTWSSYSGTLLGHLDTSTALMPSGCRSEIYGVLAYLWTGHQN